MKTFFKSFKASCKEMRAKWKQVIPIALIDLVYFMSFGFVFFKIWEKSMVHVDAVLNMMNIDLGGFVEEQSEEQLAAVMARYSEFSAHYDIITKYLIIFYIAAIAFWIVFQGINWYRANKMAGKKQLDFWSYAKRFAVVSVVFGLLFGLIQYMYFKLAFYSSMATVQVVGDVGSKVLVFILTFLLFCFAYTSYALLPKYNLKKIFQETAKKLYKDWMHLLMGYASMIFILALAYYLFMQVMALGGGIAFLYGVVILLPLIAWTRIYALNIVEK